MLSTIVVQEKFIQCVPIDARFLLSCCFSFVGCSFVCCCIFVCLFSLQNEVAVLLFCCFLLFCFCFLELFSLGKIIII